MPPPTAWLLAPAAAAAAAAVRKSDRPTDRPAAPVPDSPFPAGGFLKPAASQPPKRQPSRGDEILPPASSPSCPFVRPSPGDATVDSLNQERVWGKRERESYSRTSKVSLLVLRPPPLADGRTDERERESERGARSSLSCGWLGERVEREEYKEGEGSRTRGRSFDRRGASGGDDDDGRDPPAAAERYVIPFN